MQNNQNKLNKIEILAPCGSADALKAAVRQGADAVYIGLSRFSARAYADNFSGEELMKSASYCRLHGVKLHAAVNTLVSDEELESALNTAVEAYLAGADAFIVQDIGLAMLIKKACPEAELHASTQMTAHTPEGARFLYGCGFDRVVLAREMNKSEIAEIVNSCPVDTEVFVHGALCMCVSGQCYMSAMLGGRSGNRGRCAQPCRLPFRVKSGTGHDLSLKDNSIIDRLSELQSLGVTSAKIEGRMKRPEYVAAAVRACRDSVDNGSADKEQLERLKAVFSRNGFTDGYYNGRLGRSMFGTRSKEDVTAASEKLLSEIRSEYRNESQTNAVSFFLRMKSGEPAFLTAESRGHCVTVEGEAPVTAIKKALTSEKAAEQLNKTGGTAFYAENIGTEIEPGLTIPLSELNSMRRHSLEKLTHELERPPVRNRIPIDIWKPVPYRRNGGLKLRASFRDCDISDSFRQCELIYVPLFSDVDQLKRLKDSGFNVGVRIPRIIFGRENSVSSQLKKIKNIGITDVYCGNIGTAALAIKLGLSVHGGFSLNVFNTRSLNFFEHMGLCDTEVSIELTSRQINSLGGKIPRGIAGSGYLPLMIMRNCPNKNGDGCRTCRGRSRIKDRKGIEFSMMCEGGCTELLNSDLLLISDKQGEFPGIDFMTLLFTYESREECERILDMYLSHSKPDGRFTRGLYFRGVE